MTGRGTVIATGDLRIAPIPHAAIPGKVADEGFRIAPAHQRQTVTGLIVDSQVHLPHPTDPRRADPAYLAQLAGRIAWLDQITPTKATKLRTLLQATLTCLPTPHSHD